jgi:DNA-binding GntR family transcriptional regulator
VIYQMAAALAMAVMTAKDVAPLEAAVVQMAAVVASPPVDLRQYQQHHRVFHETIMTLAGNDRLTRIERNLRFQVSRISYTSLQDPGHLQDSLAYHRRIAAAMRQGDRPLACRLMKEHVLDALDVALRLQPDESGEPASGAGPFPADADLLEVAL